MLHEISVKKKEEAVKSFETEKEIFYIFVLFQSATWEQSIQDYRTVSWCCCCCTLNAFVQRQIRIWDLIHLFCLRIQNFQLIHVSIKTFYFTCKFHFTSSHIHIRKKQVQFRQNSMIQPTIHKTTTRWRCQSTKIWSYFINFFLFMK